MIGDEPTNTDPLQKLRAALHDKAKSAPNFRFYSLYDKVYRRDVLEAAWQQCRVNGGAPGVDGQSFKDIEEYGLVLKQANAGGVRHGCLIEMSDDTVSSQRWQRWGEVSVCFVFHCGLGCTRCG